MSDRTPHTPSAAGYFFRDDRANRLCLYPGRACYQLRDLKRNGHLHRFCRTHRQRHNQYQRESQERRQHRQQRRLAALTTAPTLVQIEWSVALDQLVAAQEGVTDEELVSLLHELFGGPDPEIAPDGLTQYQQFDVDLLPDDPENSHYA